MKDGKRWLVEAVRRACIDAAVDGYEQASIGGLCRDGAWEAAVSAIRRVDLDALAERAERDDLDPGAEPRAAAEPRPQPGRPSTRGRSRIGA